MVKSYFDPEMDFENYLRLVPRLALHDEFYSTLKFRFFLGVLLSIMWGTVIYTQLGQSTIYHSEISSLWGELIFKYFLIGAGSVLIYLFSWALVDYLINFVFYRGLWKLQSRLYERLLTLERSKKAFIKLNLGGLDFLNKYFVPIAYGIGGVMMLTAILSVADMENLSIFSRFWNLIPESKGTLILGGILSINIAFLVISFWCIVNLKKIGLNKAENKALFLCNNIGILHNVLYYLVVIFFEFPLIIVLATILFNTGIGYWNLYTVDFMVDVGKIDTSGSILVSPTYPEEVIEGVSGLIFDYKLDFLWFLQIYRNLLPVGFIIILSLFIFGIIIPNLYINGIEYSVILTGSFFFNLLMMKVSEIIPIAFNLPIDIIISIAISFSIYLTIKSVDSILMESKK